MRPFDKVDPFLLDREQNKTIMLFLQFIKNKEKKFLLSVGEIINLKLRELK